MNQTEKYSLRCPVCLTEFTSLENVHHCEKCDAPTIVKMDGLKSLKLGRGNGTSMWRYFDLLPLADKKWIISQGEGGTPLVKAPGLGDQIGVPKLLLKNETTNPTGAFKDRQVSFGISKAREANAESIAVVSSGNVAAAAASYCACAGLPCRVFTPGNAPNARLIQARVYGAKFYKVNTVSSSLIFKLVRHACKRNNWHLLSTAGLYNPFQVEGAKTIAYEIYDQSETLPDWVITPVGGGGLLGAIWRGFCELKEMGLIDHLPHLAGVQSEACSPLVKAVEKGLTPKEVVDNPVEVGETIAGAIADDILFDAYSVIPAVTQTGGTAVAVTDAEMMEAEKMLAQKAGIFAEPTSAATIAGLIRLRQAGVIKDSQSVCCVITGSGFKDMEAAGKIIDEPVPVEPEVAAFDRLEE